MSWIHKFLSDEERNNIENAISRVEESTSCEIVPVIVKRSSSVGHVPLTLTLIIVLIIVVAELPYSDWLWVMPWVWIWPFLIIVIYYLSQVLAKIHWIQKNLVPEKDEIAQVHQRAHLEFYTNKIHRTENGTGVLIFVSVMEKKAVILADEEIAKKLPKETWDQVLQELRNDLGEKKWGEGFVKAIEKCGELLKTHFPMVASARNELKNHVVVKD